MYCKSDEEITLKSDLFFGKGKLSEIIVSIEM